ILSLPSVVVNNNVAATVTNTEKRPTQNVSQGTATTSTGAGEDKDAGINLSISPSISSNNYLRLTVDLKVSRFTTPFDPTAVTAGVSVERSITTQVTMPSGATMVLGGVIQDSESSSDDGVPFLKDIPLLGWLFRSYGKTKDKTNLYFFLTANILDETDFSDLAEISFRKKMEAAQYIGHKRIQLIDRRWREPTLVDRLEDSGSTVEDLDQYGGFELPTYKRQSADVTPAPGRLPPLPPHERDALFGRRRGRNRMLIQDQISEGLLRKAGLTDEQIAKAIGEERETGKSLDQVLIARNFLPELKVLELFGEILGLEVRTGIESTRVPPEFIQNVPVQFARSNHLVALEQHDHVLKVATCRPRGVQRMDDLATMMGCEVEPVLAPKQETAGLNSRAYRHQADGVDEAMVEIEEQDIVGLANTVEESEDLLNVANKAPIIKLVNMLLFQALKLRASDIHLQPYPDRLQVRMRIDGVLYDTEAIPKKAQEAIISRVKVMGKMDIAERRLPQDGRASIRIGDGDVDVRISCLPVQHGERIVFRILDKTTKVYSLD